MKIPTKSTASALLLVITALAMAPGAAAADPVRERVDGFKASKRSIAAIEDAMSQGDLPSVAEQARVLAVFAEKIPSLFPPDANPGFFSGAKGAIWQDFPDFTAKAGAMYDSARQLEQTATSPQADVGVLQQRLRQVQNACMSCHNSYKRGR